MAAKRPKKTKTVTPPQAARLRRKWRGWIKHIALDVGLQLSNFDTFKELQTIVAANPEIHNPSHFHNWCSSNYGVAATVALRRIDDEDYRSQSLGTMLNEMLIYPGVVTRRSHRAMYKKNPELADRTFDQFAGQEEDFLGPKRIQNDLKKIKTSCARIRLFVNKRAAHIGNKGAIRKNVTFGELENALGEIDSIVCDYQLVLLGVGSETQKPTLQYDWTEVFHRVWIPRKDSREGD